MTVRSGWLFFEYGFIMSLNAFGFSMRYNSDCDIADTSNDVDELNSMYAFSGIFRGFSVHIQVHRPLYFEILLHSHLHHVVAIIE